MTEQHTPGEWVFRADDMMIVRLSPRGGLLDNLHIAEIKRQGPETEANARLIAAAPETAAERDRLRADKAELVAALEGIANNRLSTDVPEDERADHDYAQGWDTAVTIARAATAKPKGEAP